MSEFRAGQQVEADGKRGVVLETHTSGSFSYDGEEFEVGDGEEMYVVAHEDGTGVFSASDMSESSWRDEVSGDPDEAKSAKANAYNAANHGTLNGMRTNRMRLNDIGFDSWPDSWEDSDKPARLIALDAWFSMGGTWSACHRELHSKRLCSAFKDEIYQTTEWR